MNCRLGPECEEDIYIYIYTMMMMMMVYKAEIKFVPSSLKLKTSDSFLIASIRKIRKLLSFHDKNIELLGKNFPSFDLMVSVITVST